MNLLWFRGFYNYSSLQPYFTKECQRQQGDLTDMVTCSANHFVTGFRLYKGGSHYGVTQVKMYCRKLLEENSTETTEPLQNITSTTVATDHYFESNNHQLEPRLVSHLLCIHLLIMIIWNCFSL